MTKSRIAIVGANFAGLSAAAKLPKSLDVTLIDSRSTFEWTPNIHEILSGIKSVDDVSLSLADVAGELGHRFIQETVTNLDPDNNRLEFSSGRFQEYDALLLACGQSQANWGVEGVEEFTRPFRRAEDVAAIKNKIESRLDRGEITRVTVVGAGFTGIELIGELLRKYRDNDLLQIKVIDYAHRIASALPATLAKNITKLCQGLNVEFFLGRKITSVSKEYVELDNDNKVGSDIIVWTTGTETPELVAQSTVTADSKSGISVNDCLQSYSHANVFAAGDICASPWKLTKQAGYAIDMGHFAATNLQRWLKGKRLRTFKPMFKPVALAFGDLNTYIIQGDNVIASPILASAKEAIFQIYMARFSKPLAVLQFSHGVFDRARSSVRHLLPPQLSLIDAVNTAKRSRVLQLGRPL